MNLLIIIAVCFFGSVLSLMLAYLFSKLKMVNYADYFVSLAVGSLLGAAFLEIIPNAYELSGVFTGEKFLKNIWDHFDKRDFSKLGKSNVLSSHAMIASSHPIAASIGIEILKSGGNAVDAAIAMNAVLCVAEPHMTGVGGDCFVMLSVDGSTNIKALNGSGKSSSKAKASKLRKRNISVLLQKCQKL